MAPILASREPSSGYMAYKNIIWTFPCLFLVPHLPTLVGWGRGTQTQTLHLFIYIMYFIIVLKDLPDMCCFLNGISYLTIMVHMLISVVTAS